jgi:16S rRNA (cytidine1402-2'-O)-methyltransferase
MIIKPGSLYIVSTPIGHLADMTQRAVDVLRAVDLIAAEDTRHSKKLLAHYAIDTSLMAYHAHNEQRSAQLLLDKMKQGQSIALISDAGTPLVSDPGYRLVYGAIEANIDVIPIPGPSALITALSAAGLACDKFTFIGFLPSKGQARSVQLQAVVSLTHTSILYEAPHRLLALLTELQQLIPDRLICVAKELTKHYERFLRGTAAVVLERLRQDPSLCKGEFVVLISGQAPQVNTDFDHILEPLLAALPLKQAVKLAADIAKVPKNKVYQRALELRGAG